MKKYWLEILIILAIVFVVVYMFSVSADAEEIDSTYIIHCTKHGSLTEDEIATLILAGEEYYICLKCANNILTCLLELYENNQEEIDSFVKEAIIEMKRIE